MTPEEVKKIIESSKENNIKDVPFYESHIKCANMVRVIFTLLISITIGSGLVASIALFIQQQYLIGLYIIAGAIVNVLILLLIQVMWTGMYLIRVETKEEIKNLK